MNVIVHVSLSFQKHPLPLPFMYCPWLDNFIHSSRNFTRRLFDEAIKGLGRFSRHGSRSCRSLSGQNEHVAALVALPFLSTPTDRDRDHLRNLRCRGGAVHGGMPKCGRSQRLRPFKISSPIYFETFSPKPDCKLARTPIRGFFKILPFSPYVHT